MGYIADYHVEGKTSSPKEEPVEKKLRVCFDFAQEVAKINIGEVLARIRNGKDIGDKLHEYLTSCAGEALQYNSTPSGKPVEYVDPTRKVTVYPGKKQRLDFVVEVEARKNIPLERLLDCYKLDRFILTGKA